MPSFASFPHERQEPILSHSAKMEDGQSYSRSYSTLGTGSAFSHHCFSRPPANRSESSEPCEALLYETRTESLKKLTALMNCALCALCTLTNENNHTLVENVSRC